MSASYGLLSICSPSAQARRTTRLAHAVMIGVVAGSLAGFVGVEQPAPAQPPLTPGQHEAVVQVGVGGSLGNRAPAAALGRLTMRISGDRLGQEASVTVRGVAGKARGYRKEVKAWQSARVEALQPGRYRLLPGVIVRGNSMATARVQKVSVSAKGTTRVRIRFRITSSGPEPTPEPNPVSTPPPPPPDTAAPSPVSDLVVTESQAHALTISWRNPPDPDLSKILVRISNGTEAPATPTDGQQVSLPWLRAETATATGLLEDHVYSFSLFAADEQGNTSPPETITGRTADITPPSKVTGLSVVQRTEEALSLSWVNPNEDDLEGVTVRRTLGSTAPVSPTDGADVPLGSPLSESVTDFGLAEDTLYSYSVFPRDSSGNVAAPASISVRTLDVTPPGPVTALSAGNRDYGSIELRWTNPVDSDADRIIVRMRPGVEPVAPTEGEQAASVRLPANKVRVSNLEGGIPYTFTTYALDKSGNVSSPTSVTASTWSSTPLPQVSDLLVTATGATSLRLTWKNPNDSVARVRVYRWPGLNKDFWGGTEIPVAGDLPEEALDANLQKESSYTYNVIATATDGRISRTSVSITLPDLEPPHVVWQLVAGLVDPQTATLNWVNPGDEDFQSVVVRRAFGGTAPQTPTAGDAVAIATPTEEGLTDRNLEPATTYSYSVFALDEAGNDNGPMSATLTTPPAGQALTGHVVIHTLRDDLNPPATLSSGVTAVAAGQDHALAIKDGGVVAWGKNPYHETDVPAEATHDVKAIAAGSYLSAALTESGKMLAWGYPCYFSCSVPSALSTGVTDIAAGGDWYYGVKDGRVYGSGIGLPGPPPTSAQSGVTAIAAGPDHALAVKNGSVIGWGQTTVPWSLANASNIVDVSAGIDHSLALTSSGVVYEWKDDGTTVAVPADARTGVTAIAAGHWHSVVLKNGGARPWNASFDILPDEARAGVTDVSAGSYYTLAVRQDLP